MIVITFVYHGAGKEIQQEKFQGGVHHRDSRGNDSVVYDGAAQWMNAGMGVMHSERPPNDIHDLLDGKIYVEAFGWAQALHAVVFGKTKMKLEGKRWRIPVSCS